MILYYRHEGQRIRLHKIGFQWWHGPNFFFRTVRTVWIVGIGGGNVWKHLPFGVFRDPFTLDDYVQNMERKLRCRREHFPKGVIEDFYQ